MSKQPSQPKLKKTDFWYELPKDLIAEEPCEPRDQSRLFVYQRATKKLAHKTFVDLADYLRAGDLLILNNTKVIRARLLGEKVLTGGRLEVFLLKKCRRLKTHEEWQVLLKGKVTEGLEIKLSQALVARVLKNNFDGTWQVVFNFSGSELKKIIESIGHMPLPPYIRKGLDRPVDEERYQTVFAKSTKAGSVAAPTAGLHFTPGLLKKLKLKGVKIAEVTLQVGLGTFLPVKTALVAEHQMHAEQFTIPVRTLQQIIETKKHGGRVIAVGTTAARTLESAAGLIYLNPTKALSGWTSIFIYPPYKFQVVDGLVTNFHLPESTLLMMLAAFLTPAGYQGIEIEQQLYAEAIKQRYRFFSYGDAMLIL